MYYNNLAPLFFAKNLNDFYYHTVVTCALYQGKEKAVVLDRKDYNSDLISNVDLAMNFIKQYLPVKYEFTGELTRKEIPQIPYEALREALINAVIHRDYFEKGSNVIVEIFADRLEITNPGGLVKGLTPESFGKISMLRNPGIANLFHRIDYIEKMGTGIERIRLALENAKVPQVQYDLKPSFIKAAFPRAEESLEIATKKTTQETTQETILRLIRLNPYTTREELAGKVGITSDGVKYHMEKLKKEGRLRHSGPRKKGEWEVLNGNEESKL